MQNSMRSTEGSAQADPMPQWNSTIEAFRWLLILGFPASVAAARVMPELFSDAIDEAVELAWRVTRNPFGHSPPRLR